MASDNGSQDGAKVRVLSLGLAHKALIKIDTHDNFGDRLLVIEGLAPEAVVVIFSCGPLTRFLGRMLYRSALSKAGVLDVVRLIDVGQAAAPSPRPADLAVRERAIRSMPDYVRHVVDLAADAEVAEPPLVAFDRPIISLVVPVYNATPDQLNDLLASFQSQQAGLSELILSDDGSSSQDTLDWLSAHGNEPSVRIAMSELNRGIAKTTNAGIRVATGDWVGLVDHDDALTPFAIARIVRALNARPDCRFLYTDEIIADTNLRPVDCFFKPAWDPVLLSGVNYINHLSLYRRERLLGIGGLRTGYEGSQDYDLVLRYTAGLAQSEIYHLPYPAYIWRRSDQTYSARFLEKATAAARATLAQHYGEGRSTIDPALSDDLHRVRFDLSRTQWPTVSIIIPNKDAPRLLKTVLSGLDRTDYPDHEIIVIDNGSTDRATLQIYDDYKRSNTNFTVRIEDEAFNFSRSINKGIALSKGKYILLLNNDIEMTDRNWLKEMVSCFDYKGVGIVGAKLLYPSRTIQHIGVIAGLGELAGHWFIGADAAHPGPMGRFRVRQSLSCVTGACLLVSRECAAAAGAFDEINFAIAYNDIDYCLRAVNAGFRVVLTPFACLIHHESATRGSDEAPDKIARFKHEQSNLVRIHRTDVFEDRAYNPWLSRHTPVPTPIVRRRLPKAR